MLSILGRKLGMTQVFDEKGNAIPVTVVEAGPCPIFQVKTPAKDGYAALQIGFGSKKAKNTPKALRGHFAKSGGPNVRMLREVRHDAVADFQPGQSLGVDIFEIGSFVDVIGITKGRGFQGVVKRHGFKAGHASHGPTFGKQPGSIGASAYPSRVVKGKKLPGHMGAERFTALNLKVVGVDKERNLIWVRGSVPGHTNAFVVVRQKA